MYPALGSAVRSRRVVIVTGASSGIGLALAERAARGGFDVFAVGRRSERLDRLQEDVDGAIGSIATLAIDVTERGAARTIARAALAHFGRIDILVNNAGGVAVGRISEQSDDALREQVDTHVVAPLALLRETLPALLERRGHVFFVGSGVARIPVNSLGAYPAAKAAVRNFTRIVRGDLRPHGVAVTYVDPGAVATEFMTRAGFSGPPGPLAASPHDVARRIYDAFTTRPDVVNGVPWQTAVVALGEKLPGVTDWLLSLAPQIVGVRAAPRLTLSADVSSVPALRSLPAAPPPPPPVALPESIPPQERVTIPESKPAATGHDSIIVAHDAPEHAPSDGAAPEEPEARRSFSDATRSLSVRLFGSLRDRVALHDATPETDGLASPFLPIGETAPTMLRFGDAPEAEEPPVAPTVAAFDEALAGVARRMERLNLSQAFVERLLVPGEILVAGDLALRWAGMPNKNERALMTEVLQALASAGFLEHLGEDRYLVVTAREL